MNLGKVLKFMQLLLEANNWIIKEASLSRILKLSGRPVSRAGKVFKTIGGAW